MGAAQTPVAAARPRLEPALSRAELAMSERDYPAALTALNGIGETPDIFANYYLGICLAEMQRPGEAASRFEKVLSSAGVPAEIAEDCRARLEAHRVPSPQKRFRLYYRAGYGYDSNVTLQPDDSSLVIPSGKGDFGFSNEVGVGITPITHHAFDLDVAYRFFNTVYNDIGEFNMLGNELAGVFTLKGETIRPFAGYGYGYYFLDDCAQSYLRRNRLFGGANVSEGGMALTQLLYELSFDDYFLRYFEPGDNRDAHNNRFGLNQYCFPAFTRGGFLRGGFFYDRNSAEGKNYYYNGFRLEAEYSQTLTAEMWLDLNAEYYFRDYTRNTEGRRDHEQVYSALLTRRLSPHLSLSAEYNLFVNNSTEALFEYKRNIFSLFATVVF